MSVDLALLSAVIADAARAASVPAWGLVKGDRTQKVAHARFMAAWVARTGLGASMRDIAKALGDRDHSTIIHAIRRAEQLRLQDPQYRTRSDLLLGRAVARKANSRATASAARKLARSLADLTAKSEASDG